MNTFARGVAAAIAAAPLTACTTFRKFVRQGIDRGPVTAARSRAAVIRSHATSRHEEGRYEELA